MIMPETEMRTILPITAGQLVKIYAPCRIALANKFVDHLNSAMAAAEMTSLERVAAFLAQVGHESGRLLYVREIWNPAQCPWQARYEGRADLGNFSPGDGSKFRGRGLIQITGRANYAACAAEFGLPLLDQPELLEQPQYAALSAVWFWQSHKLNALADQGEFKKITRVINGGLNGLEDRLYLWESARRVLKDSD